MNDYTHEDYLLVRGYSFIARIIFRNSRITIVGWRKKGGNMICSLKAVVYVYIVIPNWHTTLCLLLPHALVPDPNQLVCCLGLHTLCISHTRCNNQLSRWFGLTTYTRINPNLVVHSHKAIHHSTNIISLTLEGQHNFCYFTCRFGSHNGRSFDAANLKTWHVADCWLVCFLLAVICEICDYSWGHLLLAKNHG